MYKNKYTKKNTFKFKYAKIFERLLHHKLRKLCLHHKMRNIFCVFK